MRLNNNYSSGYSNDSKINEIRGLTNEYGLNLSGTVKSYNEDDIIKKRCHKHQDKAKNK